MPAPRRTAIAAVTAALALSPATALAQNGAGDEQYSDPFSGSSTSKPKTQSSPAPAQAAPAQQAQSTPAAPAAPAATGGTSSAPAATGAQLPRTGADVLPLALLGLVLLGAGVALLRRRGAHAGD